MFTLDYNRTFCKQLLHLLEERLPKCGSRIPEFAASTLLHPTYKVFTLSDLGSKNDALHFLQEKFDAPAGDSSTTGSGSTTPDSGSEPEFMTAEARAKAMQKAMKKKTGREASETGSQDMTQMFADTESTLSPIQLELNTYMKLDLPRGMHVLNFWKLHEKDLPLLSKAARQLLCIQATSCSSERAFSTGGLTVTAKRTKLDPENVHMLVYCKENLQKVTIRKWLLSDEEEEAAEGEIEIEGEGTLEESTSETQSQK